MVVTSPIRNIPAITTSLVGREADLSRLKGLVLRPDVSLVTLLGTGGVGKTRLILQLAAEIDQDIVGDVHVVLLASSTDVESVLHAIARALGIEQSPTSSLVDHLADAIGDQPVLLVLDNLDQVASHLAFLPKLLGRCPLLKIVATSQVMLRLSAERVFPVDPLPITGSGDHPSPAAQLFIERALALNPAFDLSPENLCAIDSICRQVDGLPLAIELAAARSRYLSASGLCERLTERLRLLTGGPLDAPERHRTLRALLTWSHDLLSSDERVLFRRLAVFEPSAPFDAVEPVCNAAGDLGVHAEDVLASLFDHSLVKITDTPATGPRVRMLNTVREFAREQLQVSGEEDAVRHSHATWFARYVSGTPTSTWRTGTAALGVWMSRNLPDTGNFSLAVEHLYECGDQQTVLRLVTSLVPFWLEIGQVPESAKWTPKVEPFAADAPPDLQAMYFRMAAAMAMKDDRNDLAVTYAARALEAAQQVGDLRLLSNCQNMLGQMYWRAGDPVQGERYQMAAIETIRRDPDPMGGALFAVQMAEWLVGADQLDRAESLLREAIPVVAAERPGALPIAQGTMADLMIRRGNFDEASVWLERSLDYHLEPPHRLPSMLAGRLLSAGNLAVHHGQLDVAAGFVGSALAICHRLGLIIDTATNDEMDRLMAPVREAYGPERAEALVRAGKQRSMSDTLAAAIAVCRLRQGVQPQIPAAAPAGDLTPRERDVLALLAQGLSNLAIADALSISERTVTTHLSRLYAKLDVSTRSEAIALALRTDLVAS